MVKPIEDFTGRVYGDLSVIKRGLDRQPGRQAKDRRGRARWECRCTCGKPLLLTRSQILDARYHQCRHQKAGMDVPVRLREGNRCTAAPVKAGR